MKTHCVSATGFSALTDNAKLIKIFHLSMALRQDSALSASSFLVICKVA